MAQSVLQQVTPHARPGVEGGENEERLEHEREVVPDAEPLAAHDLGEKIRHAHGERGRAAGAAVESFFFHGPG